MYHLKNSLYTACKVGDKEALKSLLAILFSPHIESMEVKGQKELGQGHRNEGNVEYSFKESGQGHRNKENVEDNFKQLGQGHRNEENSFNGVTEIEFKHLGNKEIAREPREDFDVKGSEKTIHSQQENAKDETPVSNIIVSQQSKSCAVNDFMIDELKQNVNETHKSHSSSISASSNIDTVTDVETVKEISECPNLHLKEAENNDSEKVTSKPDIVKENIADVNTSKENSTDSGTPDIVNENIADVNQNKENSNDTDKADIVNKNIVDVKPSKENSTDAGIDYSKSQSAVHSGKASLNLVTSSSMSGMVQMLTDYSPVVTPALLSEPFGDNNTTFLHVAAKEGHGKIITILMEAGANPALRYIIVLSVYVENAAHFAVYQWFTLFP